MSDKKLVRIKPKSPRETHVFKGYHFRKSDGWYEVPAAIAEACAKETLHDMNPDASPLIFDVKDKEEAQQTAEVERQRVEPAGTPDKPKVIKASEPETAAETPRAKAEEGEKVRQAQQALSAREREIAVRERELEEREQALAQREGKPTEQQTAEAPAAKDEKGKKGKKPAEEK